MKKRFFLFCFFIIMSSLWSQDLFKNTLINKMTKEKTEYERLFCNENILFLDYKEFFFSTDRSIEEKVYTDGKNMHLYIYEDKILLTELLINDGNIWEIHNDKKKNIKQNHISDSFFSFWWSFVTVDDLTNFSEIDDMYFCENIEHNYKFLFNKEYDLKQLEFSINGTIIRYKINQNYYIDGFNIPFSSDSIVYQDSIAVKQSILENCYFIEDKDELLSDKKYKSFTFFDSLNNYFQKSRTKK